MQNVLTGRRHRGIKHRRNRNHHGIAFGLDSPFPVSNPHRMNGQIVEATGIKAQVQMEKGSAGWSL